MITSAVNRVECKVPVTAFRVEVELSIVIFLLDYFRVFARLPLVATLWRSGLLARPRDRDRNAVNEGIENR